MQYYIQWIWYLKYKLKVNLQEGMNVNDIVRSILAN